MMRDVYLQGVLAERYGAKPFHLDVASTGEAVRALCALHDGFKDDIKKGTWHVLIKTGETYYDIGIDEITMSLGQASEIHIVPALKGAGNSNMKTGLLKIVLGVALAAGAFFLAPAAGLGAVAFGAGGMGITYGQLALVGVALAVAGAASMLSPQEEKKDEKDDSSYVISPSENTAVQGSSVPVVIGRFLTGSVVMSIGVSTEQIGSDGTHYPAQD